MVKRWIQETGMKKGALRRQFEAHKGEIIPAAKLNEADRKPVGGKMRTLRGHSLTVTAQLKRRVRLAKRLREIKR